MNSANWKDFIAKNFRKVRYHPTQRNYLTEGKSFSFLFRELREEKCWGRENFTKKQCCKF